MIIYIKVLVNDYRLGTLDKPIICYGYTPLLPLMNCHIFDVHYVNIGNSLEVI